MYFYLFPIHQNCNYTELHIERNYDNGQIMDLGKSGIDDFFPAFTSQVDRKYYSDDCQDNDYSDEVDQYVDDRSVAAHDEQLMIFIKDRIKDRKP